MSEDRQPGFIMIPGTAQVRNLITGELVESKDVKFGMVFAPLSPGQCDLCGVDHRDDEPHNWQSLRFQYMFRAKEGRWPETEDAFSHVSNLVYNSWKRSLEKFNVILKPRPKAKPGPKSATDSGRKT